MLAGLVFTGWQAWHVRGELTTVADQLSSMTDAVAAGDLEQAQTRLDEASGSATTANRHTRGPYWWTASKLPWVGDDVTAVRTVASTAHDLTDGALPRLVEAGTALSAEALTPKNGAINLRPIAEAAPRLSSGADRLERNEAAVAALDTRGLTAQLKGPVEGLQDKLNSAVRITRAAATAAELLPPMLGAEGERTYVMLFQNNAEMRGAGGMPGAFMVIRADKGKIRLTRQAKPRDIGYLDPPVMPISDEERRLFTDRISTYSQDTVINPHFPRAAELFTAMWKRTQRQDLDGVFSVDPVSVGYILGATGPVQVSDRTLTAANAADTLLRDVYLQIDDDEAQNVFFSNVAAEVFGKVRDGRFDPAAFVRALDRGVAERRIIAWSAHEDEQRVLSGTTIAHEVPSEATRRPEIGVYLNDSGSDKLTYYLDHRVDVTPRSCGSNGNQILDVKVILRSRVPKNDPLTEWVVGPGTAGVKLGDMLITSYLYAPVGGRIDEVRYDGEQVNGFETTHRNREVGVWTALLGRGEKHVLSYRVYTGPRQTGEARVLTTPGVRTSGVGSIGESAC